MFLCLASALYIGASVFPIYRHNFNIKEVARRLCMRLLNRDINEVQARDEFLAAVQEEELPIRDDDFSFDSGLDNRWVSLQVSYVADYRFLGTNVVKHKPFKWEIRQERDDSNGEAE